MEIASENLFRCADVHGICVNRSSLAQALREVEILIEHRRGEYVCFFEANLFSRALTDRAVREVINGATLVYPDGIAPAKCASYRAKTSFPRVAGPTFLLKACEYGLDKNWRHFFLGGAEGVAEQLAENLKLRFPGLQISGTYCPPFRPLTEDEEREVKTRIEAGHTDLLWVGLGGPKQEFWMRAHQGKLDVPVMLGVGAAFDFHSGNRPWAPRIVREFGLEWLWRMFSGGYKTLLRNLRCVAKISFVLLSDLLCYRLIPRRKVPLRRRESTFKSPKNQ